MSEFEDNNKQEQTDYKNFSRMIMALEKQTETTNPKIKIGRASCRERV